MSQDFFLSVLLEWLWKLKWIETEGGILSITLELNLLPVRKDRKLFPPTLILNPLQMKNHCSKHCQIIGWAHSKKQFLPFIRSIFRFACGPLLNRVFVSSNLSELECHSLPLPSPVSPCSGRTAHFSKNFKMSGAFQTRSKMLCLGNSIASRNNISVASRYLPNSF